MKVYGQSLSILAATLFLFVFSHPGQAVPQNDNFANRETIPYYQVGIYSTNQSATVEPDEPFAFHVTSTVWYTWTAPISGSVRLSVESSDFSPVAHLLRGDTLETLEFVTVVLDKQFVDVEVTAGTVYQLRVGCNAPTPFPPEGTFFLRLLYNPPANDSFGQRTALLGAPVQVTGHNVGSTEDYQDPPSFHELSTVWYSWVAPSSGAVEVTIDSTNFSPLLRVFEGNTLGSLTNKLWVFWGRTNRFEAVAGTEYQIRVAGNAPTPFPKPEGIFTFSLGYRPPPANDSFTNRILLAGTNIIFYGSTISAGREQDEPVHGQACGAHSVWYSWKAPEAGVATLSARPEYYPFLSVYTGTNLSTLSLVASNAFEIGQTCCVSFPVLSNTIYQIAVDACLNNTEEFTGNLRLEPFPRLEVVGRTSTGALQLRSRGEYFGKLTVEASSNLVQWSPFFTNFFYTVEDGVLIQDTQAANHSRRFYRAMLTNW